MLAELAAARFGDLCTFMLCDKEDMAPRRPALRDLRIWFRVMLGNALHIGDAKSE